MFPMKLDLLSNMSMPEVQKAARFLAETSVYPELEGLRRMLEEPSRPWHKRAVGFFKDVPQLAGAFATMPKHIAIAKVLAKLGEVFADLRDEQLEREKGAMNRSGFYYLLRLPEVVYTRSN